MSGVKLFADTFYSERENLIRERIGPKVDRLKEELKQLYSPCMTRLCGMPPKKESRYNVRKLGQKGSDKWSEGPLS